MRKHHELKCAAAAALTLALAPDADAQIARAKIREGDQPVGAPAGDVVASISDVAVNQTGGYACTLNTSGSAALSHVWANGAVVRTEQTNLAGYDQTAFESFFGIDDNVAVSYGPTCTDLVGGGTGLDTVWLDSTPIAVEEQPIPTLPGKKYRFNSRPGITGSGVPYWVGGINDIATNASEGNGLFVGTGATCVLKTGDPAPAPLTSLLGANAIDFDVRLSALATNYILQITTTDATSADAHLVKNGAIVLDAGGNRISEGQLVSAAAGGNGVELWQNFGSMGVNEAGDWFFGGDTNAATTADGVLVKNGVILHREGQVLDGVTLSGNPSMSAMNEQGDIAFLWPGTGAIDTIFLNGIVVAQEGDQVDWDNDGVLDAGTSIVDVTGLAAVQIGRRIAGVVQVVFTADVDVSGTVLEGLFVVDVSDSDGAFCAGDGTGTPCPCANESALGADEGCLNSLGTGGKLVASGTASIASDSIILTGSGMPASSALYFQGTGVAGLGAGTVFGDGLRCASGSIVRLGTKTNVAGGSQYPELGDLSVSVRGLVTPGLRTYQIWYRNAASFCTVSTFNLSNGWRLTWTP